MSTFRVQKTNRYTVIHNASIQDKKISFKARGIHCLLLSYPDDWKVTLSHLVQQSDKDQMTALRSGIQELIDTGYIVRQQKRSESGGFDGYDYDVYEVPIQLDGTSDDTSRSRGNPNAENLKTVENKGPSPHAGNPNTGNQTLLSTKRNQILKEEIKENVVLSDDSHFSEEPTAVVEPEPMEIPVTATALDEGQLEKPKASRTRKGVAVPKTADQIYAAISDLEAFNRFWGWYKTKICTIPAQNASPGSKTDAAKQWLHLEQTNFLGKGFDQFRDGCKKARALAVETQGIGTRHACRFLCPANNSPVWLEQLDDAAPIGDFLEDEQRAATTPAPRPAPVAIDIPAYVHQMGYQQQQDWMAEQRRQISAGTWEAPQSTAPTEDIPANPERLAELMGGLAA